MLLMIKSCLDRAVAAAEFVGVGRAQHLARRGRECAEPVKVFVVTAEALFFLKGRFFVLKSGEGEKHKAGGKRVRGLKIRVFAS